MKPYWQGVFGENQLAMQENGLGSEWVRAPRLTPVGAERAHVLSIIRRGNAERPRLPATAGRRKRAGARQG